MGSPSSPCLSPIEIKPPISFQPAGSVHFIDCAENWSLMTLEHPIRYIGCNDETMILFLYDSKGCPIMGDGGVIGWKENTFGDEGHPDFNLGLKLSRVFLDKRVN